MGFMDAALHYVYYSCQFFGCYLYLTTVAIFSCLLLRLLLLLPLLGHHCQVIGVLTVVVKSAGMAIAEVKGQTHTLPSAGGD